MKTAIIIAAALMLSGCASITTPGEDGYRLGETTRTYCETADPATRAAGRRLAALAGITLIDLCRAYDYVSEREAS